MCHTLWGMDRNCSLYGSIIYMHANNKIMYIADNDLAHLVVAMHPFWMLIDHCCILNANSGGLKCMCVTDNLNCSAQDGLTTVVDPF